MTFRIPPTRWTWPVTVTFNNWNWNGEPGGGCKHGPKSESWPRWKFVAFSWLELVKGNAYLYRDRPAQHSSRRLWIYTRWGTCHVDVTIDRRRRLVLTEIDA